MEMRSKTIFFTVLLSFLVICSILCVCIQRDFQEYVRNWFYREISNEVDHSMSYGTSVSALSMGSEPSTVCLLGLGLLGFVVMRKKTSVTKMKK